MERPGDFDYPHVIIRVNRGRTLHLSDVAVTKSAENPTLLSVFPTRSALVADNLKPLQNRFSKQSVILNLSRDQFGL
jgi:hypothetical protein